MRVSPFRHLRISGYLLLPAAFRSLSRLSSALSAKASTLRSFLLDLFPTVSIAFETGSAFQKACNSLISQLCLRLFGVNFHLLAISCVFSDVLIKISQIFFLNTYLCMKFSRYTSQIHSFMFLTEWRWRDSNS